MTPPVKKVVGPDNHCSPSSFGDGEQCVYADLALGGKNPGIHCSAIAA